MTATESITGTTPQIDRLALALSSPRSRRRLFALGAAAAALAVSPASAARGRRAAADSRDGTMRGNHSRPRGSGMTKAAATAAIPALDPRAFAGNPALNEFNLLMNRLFRNREAWRIAIAAPVAPAQRKQVAALGASIADDLGRIARYEKTLAAGRSITWAEAAAKLKAMGIDEEFRKRGASQPFDAAIARIVATHGPTLGDLFDTYLAARPAISADCALIRRQASEVGRTGMISGVTTPPERPDPGPPLPSCQDITDCVMRYLVLSGCVMAIVTIAFCIYLGPAAPQCIGLLLGYVWFLVEAMLRNSCGVGAECRR
ncbi:MAG: hypothetical protein ACKOWF_09210 [Chloroflexota bacterium]